MDPLRLLPLLALVIGACAGIRPSPASPPDAARQTVVPDTARPSPYAALAPVIRAALEAGYHDPRELGSPAWVQFWRDLDRGLAEARTDQAVAVRFGAAARTLGVSHLELSRRGSVRAAAGAVQPVAAVRPAVRLDLAGEDGDIGVLTVDRFSIESTARPLGEALHTVASRGPRALIIDLRQNPGGDLSAMLLAGHLLGSPTVAGLFVARRWWAENDALPEPAGWGRLPRLAELDLEAFQRALRENGVLVGVVPPMEPRYDGPVYVLTSRNTASAAESVVHLLKATGRATIVGERTAGAMLSSAQVELGEGWVLRFPAADYYAADGTRLEGVGVTPDVAVPAAEALEVALRQIQAQRP
jgi:carboxyl-terminal processing protease